MKKDHEDQSKDLEMGEQNVVNVTMWVENEKSFQSRDLDSFLNDKSDVEIQNAAAFAEVVHEAENQLNMEDIEMEQCLEWFEEDHNEAFNFTSDFAEELVREERPNRVEQTKNHNRAVAEQQKKDDLLIKHSNKLLEAAENQKSHFRKTIRRLEQELQDTYNNWEASEMTNRNEMDKLRIELEKKKNNVEPNGIPEVRRVGQKCNDCRFTCKDSKTLDNHVAAVHNNQNCHLCKETFTSKGALRNHVRNHLMNNIEYSCDICENKFNNLEDAKAHAKKPCSKIRENRKSTEVKESEDSIEFDCSKCTMIFKSQTDYYKHANICSQVIEPLICEHCNIELVSKAGLKKHVEKCQTKSSNREEYNEACTNGPDCRFLKQNRCLYNHDEHNDQPWQRAQHRRQGRQEKRQQRQQQVQQRKQVHPRQQVQQRQQLQPREQVQSRQPVQPRQQVHQRQQVQQRQPNQQRQQDQSRQQDIKCRNGSGCIFWKHDRCNFLHSGPRPQGVDSRRPRRGVDSREQRQGLDSRPSRQDDDQTRPCKFGARCDRILSCGFLHLAKDFLSSQGGRRN